MQFIRDTFGETLFLWQYEFDEEIIDKEKPDIVIQIIAERNINTLLLDP